MNIIVGNKQKEISAIPSGFEKTIIDLGTGDGKFVYKKALKNPQNLYIGVDPSTKQMKKFSRKAVRKKLKNVLFVIGSIELLPKELENTADKLFIILPWGSLLEKIVNPTENTIQKLSSLIKNKGKIEIIFGYSPELEPSEIRRLDLPDLNKTYIKANILPKFKKLGNCLLEKIKPANIDTAWAKKLNFSQDRSYYKITINK